MAAQEQIEKKRRDGGWADDKYRVCQTVRTAAELVY